jgi:hypothetical protein
MEQGEISIYYLTRVGEKELKGPSTPQAGCQALKKETFMKK